MQFSICPLILTLKYATLGSSVEKILPQVVGPNKFFIKVQGTRWDKVGQGGTRYALDTTFKPQ